MLKVMVCCGNGMGSSLMIKLQVEKIFKKAGVDSTIEHSSVGDAASCADNYDVVICPVTFLDQFHTKAKLIGVKNVLSVPEITQKLKDEGIIR